MALALVVYDARLGALPFFDGLAYELLERRITVSAGIFFLNELQQCTVDVCKVLPQPLALSALGAHALDLLANLPARMKTHES